MQQIEYKCMHSELHLLRHCHYSGAQLKQYEEKRSSAHVVLRLVSRREGRQGQAGAMSAWGWTPWCCSERTLTSASVVGQDQTERPARQSTTN